jgi:hypothetical protein
MVRDERIFQELTSASIVPKLQIFTPTGRLLASIDWTFRGLVALYWWEPTANSSRQSSVGEEGSMELDGVVGGLKGPGHLRGPGNLGGNLGNGIGNLRNLGGDDPSYLGVGAGAAPAASGNLNQSPSKSAVGPQLIAVFADGTVRVFSVFCELLHSFCIDERCRVEGVRIVVTKILSI